LQHLTVPPYYIEGETVAPETTPGSTPDTTPVATESAPVINPDSMSQIDNQPQQVDSPLSAFIKYLSYGLYGVAGFAVVYAVIAIFVLLVFGKDISISGLKNSKREKNKR